jgi:Asp-tRNA(Asn)/Glu-tRNA(Gln) amidotransferase A subunit family amidase
LQGSRANAYRNQKQSERELRFTGLPHQYHLHIVAADRKIIDQPIEELVHDVQDSAVSPLDVLRTYGKVAKRAQGRTNCITEVMLPEAESWLKSEINLKGPLAGIPVSLKDSIHVKGFDATVGYSAMAGNPILEDGPMVQLLKDAGMIMII